LLRSLFPGKATPKNPTQRAQKVLQIAQERVLLRGTPKMKTAVARHGLPGEAKRQQPSQQGAPPLTLPRLDDGQTCNIEVCGLDPSCRNGIFKYARAEACPADN